MIAGGTGKFTGIQGKTAFQCKTLSAATAQGAYMHQFDYQLASEATMLSLIKLGRKQFGTGDELYTVLCDTPP